MKYNSTKFVIVIFLFIFATNIIRHIIVFLIKLTQFYFIVIRRRNESTTYTHILKAELMIILYLINSTYSSKLFHFNYFLNFVFFSFPWSKSKYTKVFSNFKPPFKAILSDFFKYFFLDFRDDGCSFLVWISCETAFPPLPPWYHPLAQHFHGTCLLDSSTFYPKTQPSILS